MMRCYCVLLITFINLSFSEDSSREKRSLSQLRQVVSVLEQQGRLHEVDGDLLKRINEALDKDSSDEAGENDVVVDRRHETAVSAKEAFLERARQRQLKLLESRERLRSNSRVNSFSQPQSSRSSVCDEYEEEIQRLQRDNQRLEQEVIMLKRELMQMEEELELSQERIEVSARHISHNTSPLNQLSQLSPAVQSSPLDKLLQAASSEEDEVLAPGVIISSSLVTPTPTVSTIFSTHSSVDTVTVTHTKELVVHFHGRAIPTEYHETEVVTTTLTSTHSSTVTITPTPTWTYLTLTQTPVTPPAPVTTPAIITSAPTIDHQQLALMERIRQLQSPSPAISAEVVEIPRALNNVQALQQYVSEMRKLKQESSIRAEPLVDTGPSTTVSTVFMSGSQPGQYSTSLVTLTLNNRYKRQVILAPTPSLTVEMSSSNYQHFSNNIELESSLL